MMKRSVSNNIVYPELSYQIMGILFKVHNVLGPTLLEKYYQRAVAKELTEQNISFKREALVRLMYESTPIGNYRLDFIIDEKLILELKANKYTNPSFYKQVVAYLRQTDLQLAILANFRRERLEYKRILNSALKDSN